MLEKPITQTYNDGLCCIYGVGNTAKPGFRPEEGLVLKTGRLRYEERVVGATRYFGAQQAKVRVDRLIRVPRRDGIDALDVCVTEDGEQFDIRQVQQPQDVVPPSTDLSLERVEVAYDIA